MLQKKILALCVVFVFFASLAFAGGAGNPVEPLKKTTDNGLGASFEYNYVADRYNKLDNKYSPASRMEVENLHEFYGKIVWGAFEHWNLYVMVGGAVYDAKYKARMDGDAEIKLDLNPGLYTGFGFNCVYPVGLEDKLGIGCDTHSGFFINEIDKLTRNGVSASKSDGTLYGIDGVSSIYLTYTYDFGVEEYRVVATPYLGAYSSWLVIGSLRPLEYEAAGSYVQETDIQPVFDVASFGVILGLDVEITKYAVFNVEGRFIGENAVTTGATIKF